MAEPLAQAEAVLEVISLDDTRKYVRITHATFLIGRGAETGNHLQLNDDLRISRNCAAVVTEGNRYYLEDRGQRYGIFVNGEKIDDRALADGDVITFGLEDSYQVIFRAASGTSDVIFRGASGTSDVMNSPNVVVGKNGSYRVDRASPFAYGRICVLFKGVDQRGAQVCLKLFRSKPRDQLGQDAISEFLREVRTHRLIEHPNVLPIIDFFREVVSGEQRMFLVLPFIEGGNLRQVIRNRDFVPLSEALPILVQIAAAIDIAHTRGIIHGDVKPENILLSADKSHTYLCDFGMAKYFAIEESISTAVENVPMRPRLGSEISMAAPGISMAGSTAYLSPEQIESGSQSPRSDIYSLALLTYELLTGRLPFDISVGAFSQMKAKVEGKLIDPGLANPYLSPAIRAALLRGLALNPNDRPSTATEFCGELSSTEPSPPGAALPMNPRSGAISVDPKQIFISYSHKDGKWLKKFAEVLTPLLQNNTIRAWDDTNIRPGGLWRNEIEEALRSAKVAVLLVSPSFLASEFIRNVEMPPLLKAASDRGVTIIWVAVSASLYSETPISHYQAANDPLRPLDALRAPDLNRELVRICTRVKEAVERKPG